MEGDYYITARKLDEDFNLRVSIALILADSVTKSFPKIQHLYPADIDDYIPNIKQISKTLVRVEYVYPIAPKTYSRAVIMREFKEMYNSGIDQIRFRLSNISKSELKEVGLSEDYTIRGYDANIQLVLRQYYSLLLTVDLEIEKF